MAKGKANRVRNSGELDAVTTSGDYAVYSIVIPQEADEIRFQVISNSSKNAFSYSFDDMFNVPSVTEAIAKNSLSIYKLYFTDANGGFLKSAMGGSIGFSQEIVIRNPSDFGQAIYFVGYEIGTDSSKWTVQWQVIGGCNTNGY